MLPTKALMATSNQQLLEPDTYRFTAVHLGSGFDMGEAAGGLGGTLAPSKAYLLVNRTSALHFLFPFGSVVTVMPASADASYEAELSEFSNYTTVGQKRVSDDFKLVLDPEQNERVEFGSVSVKSSELQKLALVAEALAQSNTLEYYENVTAALVDSSSELTEGMAQGERPPTGRKLLTFIGKSLAMRRDLVGHLSVLDPPESVWEDKSLDVLYHALRKNFEIQPRLRVVEHKLELIKDTAQLVVSINESRQSHFLEIVIIALIALEIILYLVGK
jgi:uncharacterized Rmd1/YagE family protein